MPDYTASLIYLDRFHLGDPLFLQALGKSLARAALRGLRPLLVHGQGEHVQRRLEGEGIFLQERDGVYHGSSSMERSLIDAAFRDMNRWLVGLMTEAVVPAVGFHGADRSLIEVEESEVRAGRTGWLKTLLNQSVVPIIASAGVGPGGVSQLLNPVDVISALAEEISDDVELVVFTTTHLGGIMQGSEPLPELPFAEVRKRGVLADPEGTETLVLSGARVLLTNTVRYPKDGSGRGTWIAP